MVLAENAGVIRQNEIVDTLQTVDAVLTQSAVLRPHAPALIAANGHSLTYGRLAHEAACVRDLLLAEGILSTDRVALVTPRGIGAVAPFFGIVGCAALVPIEPDIAEGEIDSVLSRLAIRFVVTPMDCPPAIEAAAHRRQVKILRTPGAELFSSPRTAIRSFDPARLTASSDMGPHSHAILLRTSGTTSRSKIVAITHMNLLACIEKVVPWYNLTPADRCLNLMPLYHGHGFTVGMLVPFLSGGSTIMPDVLDPQDLIAQIMEGSPSWVTGAASFYRMILSHAARTGISIDAPALRFMRTSSEAISQSDVESMELLTGVPMNTSYGSSEAQSHITAKPLASGDGCIGLVGFPVTSEIAVLDEKDTVNRFGEGELLIRGDTVFDGYVDDPESTDAAFHGDWFRTGDLARIEIDGSLSLCGRLKEIISRGGEKVAPGEIEDALATHPDVGEAVAFAVPHRTLGEEVCAAITLVGRDGEDTRRVAQDVRRHAARHLRAYKVPKKIFVVDALPRGRTGKLDRNRVARELTRG